VVSQITRFETVRSDLAQAIAKMLAVGKELKDLAEDEIMASPDMAKEVSVNFAMWRVYELAQSLEDEAQRLEDLEAGPSPPLSECFNNQFAEDEDMGGGEWALDDVNSEEIDNASDATHELVGVVVFRRPLEVHVC
jgi:hypothetical protein